MNVLIVAHGEEITLGWFLDALDEVGATHTLIDLSRGDDVPQDGYDKVVVLGGHMGAYEEGTYPWLAAEKDFIRRTLANETPLLGVCLGAQLVADAAGGRAFRAPSTEAGLIDLMPTPAGQADATLSAIAGPVVAWHHDSFELPDGAELLASTAEYPHAFRYRSALGVQFHPEVTPDMWTGWVSMVGSDDLESAGLDPEAFGVRLEAEAGRLRGQAVDFFQAWLEE